MRNLILSVSITFLTGTLLFVYFRNKITNIDKKLNLVFETIQEYNSNMQKENSIEMRKFAMMQHHLRNQNVQKQDAGSEEENLDKNTEENITETHGEENLIDVSDKELGNLDSDSDDETSSDEDSDDDSDDDETEDKKIKIEQSEIVEDTKIEVSNVEEDLEKKLQVDNTDYSKFTKNQLKNICEERELSGYKSLNKTKLIELLQK